MWMGALFEGRKRYMSHVPRSPDLPLERDTISRAASTASETVRSIARSLRGVSFWAAILLPITYLPLLSGGLAGSEALLFVALIAVNAGAFVLGHDYEPTTAK
jgi:hypothetical protein